MTIRIFPSKGFFHKIPYIVKDQPELHPSVTEDTITTEDLIASIAATSTISISATAQATLSTLIGALSTVVADVGTPADLAVVITASSSFSGVLAGDTQDLVSLIQGVSTVSGNVAGLTAELASLITSASTVVSSLQVQGLISALISGVSSVIGSVDAPTIGASFTIFLDDAILDHVLGVASYTPVTIFVGLFNAPPTKTGGGSEVAAGGYSRVALPAMTTAVGGVCETTAEVAFPRSVEDWGTIESIGLFDSNSGGNLMMFAAPVTAFNISAGTILRFPAGEITVQLT